MKMAKETWIRVSARKWNYASERITVRKHSS